MFLLRVIEALEHHRVDYALVGGFAVALHGALRGTIDIDLVIRGSRRDFVQAAAAFKVLGLKSPLPVDAAQVFEFREEYLRERNLIAWSFHHPDHSSELVDVILTHDLAKLKVKRVKFRDRQIRILALDDLIEMKKSSGRPQDLEDVRSLEYLRWKK
jgi:hypothetical protein